MKLNRIETLLLSNPIRRWHQRQIEARILKRLATASLETGRALLIGCGQGVEIELAFENFGAGAVDALDLDLRQVERAQTRLASRYAGRLNLWVGDGTALPVGDAGYDAVFDWGVFHHIPSWQRAVQEVARVLKPGGQFLFIEVPGHKIRAPHYKLLFDHPLKNRFERDDFAAECAASDLEVDGRSYSYLGFFFGAALKAGSAA